MKKILIFLLTTLTLNLTFGQSANLKKQIDHLISGNKIKPFNGIILISQNEKTIYQKVYGYSDLEAMTPLKLKDEFVIGSISKQFTAVIILQEKDKGRIDLQTPIRQYIPELPQKWADTVTVHHLLTHTHGIIELDKPTIFKIGTQYAYSQIGYDLLAQIAEKTSGKSFAELSKELFKASEMYNTFHPDQTEYKHLVKGYTETDDGKLVFETKSLNTHYVAAGSFISNATDLNSWNNKLYRGELLKEKTMQLLQSKHPKAIRNHPIFGITEYGYGIR